MTENENEKDRGEGEMKDTHTPIPLKVDGASSGSGKWYTKRRNQVISVIVLIVLIAGGILAFAVGRGGESNEVTQPTKDVVPQRTWDKATTGQTKLPEPKMIPGAGKGTISTVDNQQNKKVVSAQMLGIDAIGGESGASLVPPQEVDKVGYYIGSAPFGSKNKGSSVITSHINYANVTGYGAVFTTLKKGDPVTVTDNDGKVYHYRVTGAPKQLSKDSGDYAAQTKDTINKTKGKNKLVLVTCGGSFVGGALGYSDNIIVEAKYVPSEK